MTQKHRVASQKKTVITHRLTWKTRENYCGYLYLIGVEKSMSQMMDCHFTSEDPQMIFQPHRPDFSRWWTSIRLWMTRLWLDVCCCSASWESAQPSIHSELCVFVMWKETGAGGGSCWKWTEVTSLTNKPKKRQMCVCRCVCYVCMTAENRPNRICCFQVWPKWNYKTSFTHRFTFQLFSYSNIRFKGRNRDFWKISVTLEYVIDSHWMTWKTQQFYLFI